MTQLNTPYPATAYLTAFLRDLSRREQRGYEVFQADPAIDLVHRLFCPEGLDHVRAELIHHRGGHAECPSVDFFLSHFDRYRKTVQPVMRFLQNKDTTLALRLVGPDFLPRGPRFKALDEVAMVQWALQGSPPDEFEDPDQSRSQLDDPLLWAFGALGLQDRARYLASLYLDDLADVIQQGIDPHFQLSRYGERLAASVPTFAPLQKELETEEPTLVARMLRDLTKELVARFQPHVVGFTVPFPGNMLGALRMAQTIKGLGHGIKTVVGGGYVNTELRSLKEKAFFDYFDYVTFDDGEAALSAVLSDIEASRHGTLSSHGEAEQGNDSEIDATVRKSQRRLLRTLYRDQSGDLCWASHPDLHDIPQNRLPTPTYDGLPLDRYLSVVELLNPMHRLWSDGRWNKLTLAHGCYWRQCSFCDVSLDYTGRYEESAADRLVDRMEQLIAETGQTGFHFVDEACPPKVLAALSQKILDRGVVTSFWGNIRFEKSFTRPLIEKMRAAGLVAVSGGLEVASDRLLAKMKKGVSVEQVARVAGTFAEAGVLVHAYLMYGFPTQTVQETVDALERVRQLFAAGCIHSAFWHRFSCTIHSPIGKNPDEYGITVHPPSQITFASNDVEFTDPTGVDHDRLGIGLKKAVYNYMHGLGLDEDVRSWFPMRVPKTKVARNLVDRALGGP